MLWLLILYAVSFAIANPTDGMPAECLAENHKILSEPWRDHNYNAVSLIKETDEKLQRGWYRFGSGSDRLLERRELFPDFQRQNRDTFQPCGATPYQKLEIITGRLINDISPFYVLNTSHPVRPGELQIGQVVECTYQSIQLGFVKGQPRCDLPPGSPINCQYKANCNEKNFITIQIRHCGSFFVYFLHPTPPLNGIFTRFNKIPKAGLYCGTRNAGITLASCNCKSLESQLYGLPECIPRKDNSITSLDSSSVCIFDALRNVGRISAESKGCVISLNNEILRQDSPRIKDLYNKEIEKCNIVKTLSRATYIELTHRIQDIYELYDQ